MGHLSRFGRPLVAPNAEWAPHKIAIVLVTTPSRRARPSDLEELRLTLASLSSVDALRPHQVLVAHSVQCTEADDLVEGHYGFRSYQARVTSRASRESRRDALEVSQLYEAALTNAVVEAFPRARSLLVLEEGLRFAPDLLWYFAQLEPLLHLDPSLLSITGLNDNGLAPYAADATVVMRSDWFGGVAWLVARDTLRDELLPQWPASGWEQLFRSDRLRRQFLIPELSRAKRAVSAAVASRLPSVESTAMQSIPLCSERVVHLGNVSRLRSDEYHKLFLKDWPGEGLLNAVVTSVNKLKVGGHEESPWLIAFQNEDPETDQSWRPIGRFFGFTQEPPIRCTYFGVLRLRWRQSIGFLVSSASPAFGWTSPLLDPVDPSSFLAAPPPHLPPNGKLLASGVGVSCATFCQKRGGLCVSEDLLFVNTCEALAKKLECTACESGEGAEIPAKVVARQSPLFGVCYFNRNPRRTPPSCTAARDDLRRLCVCRPNKREMHAVSTDSSPSPQAPRPELQPSFAPLDVRLPVVVIAKGPEVLLTLGSLRRLRQYDPSMVLVSANALSEEVERNVSSYNVSLVLFKAQHEDARQTEQVKASIHYRFSIYHALNVHFVNSPSLIVMEAGAVAAPDFFGYFAQLEHLLLSDSGLWCVSAWNGYALSPYAANPSALLRTDVFPGLAFMLPGQLFRTEILGKWPRRSGSEYLRSRTLRGGRQCVIPEIPRILRGAGEENDYFHPGPLHDALDLGDVARLTTEVYHNTFMIELRGAELLKSATDLPPTFHKDAQRPHALSTHESSAWRFHFQSESFDADDEWVHIARFFRLPEELPARNTYHGVVRLRWGQGILFLVPSSTSLDLKQMPSLPEKLTTAFSFSKVTLPLLVPPRGSIVASGPELAGTSCDVVCSKEGRVCVSPDLAFINFCDVLQQFFFCNRCVQRSGSVPSLVGGSRASNGGICHAGENGMMGAVPSCRMSVPDAQRLCVCRQPDVGMHRKELMGPAPVSSGLSQLTDVALSTAQDAVELAAAPADVLRQTGWDVGVRADAFVQEPVNAFAGLGSPVGDLATHPSELAVVLLALSGSVAILRSCLASLQVADQFTPSSILVVIRKAMNSDALRRVTEEFRVASTSLGTGGTSKSAVEANHYRGALRFALTKHFKTNRAIVLLDDRAEFSPDLFWYFAQLEPTLMSEDSLWCVSAWNDNGLAPYVADLSALFRTDWHPSFAWMMRSATARWLHDRWPKDHVSQFLTAHAVRQGRQCVIPEISRVRRLRVASSRSEQVWYDDYVLPVAWNGQERRVHLGDVTRVMAGHYEQLFISGWPHGENLGNTTALSKISDLQKVQRGAWRLVLDRSAWKAAAAYFRLSWTGEGPPQGSYQGAVRLRWQGSVLFLIQKGSPLLARAGLTVRHAMSGASFPERPPILRAPDVAVVVGLPGESCDCTCSDANRACHDADLLFLSACSVMRTHADPGACMECIPGVEPDQPSIVVGGATEGAPTPGTCLWHANLADPPTCAASHPWTARLCACRSLLSSGPPRKVVVEPETPAVLPQVLQPSHRVDTSLMSGRCGGMFSNRLSKDCMQRGFWCCAENGKCGNSSIHCSGSGAVTPSECKQGSSQRFFCGAGWTLRLRHLGLRPSAER